MDTITTLEEDWASMKLRPRLTGLPMAVWITEKDGFPHDARVKVSPIRGGGGIWPEAASVSVRPTVRVIAGSIDPRAPLHREDLALVTAWIALNRQTIIDFWNDKIDPDDVLARLKRLETD